MFDVKLSLTKSERSVVLVILPLVPLLIDRVYIIVQHCFQRIIIYPGERRILPPLHSVVYKGRINEIFYVIRKSLRRRYIAGEKYSEFSEL